MKVSKLDWKIPSCSVDKQLVDWIFHVVGKFSWSRMESGHVIEKVLQMRMVLLGEFSIYINIVLNT